MPFDGTIPDQTTNARRHTTIDEKRRQSLPESSVEKTARIRKDKKQRQKRGSLTTIKQSMKVVRNRKGKKYDPLNKIQHKVDSIYTPKRMRAIQITMRVWYLGAFWAWLFIQLPTAIAGISAVGGEAIVRELPIAGELLSSFLPTEIILGFGMIVPVFIGWFTLVFGFLHYYFRGVSSFSTLGQHISFVAAMGLYAVPAANILPWASLWMLVVILEAKD